MKRIFQADYPPFFRRGLDTETYWALYVGIEFSFKEMPMGGAALDLTGVPLPEETLSEAKQSDAVLLGAIGGSLFINLLCAFTNYPSQINN